MYSERDNEPIKMGEDLIMADKVEKEEVKVIDERPHNNNDLLGVLDEPKQGDIEMIEQPKPKPRVELNENNLLSGFMTEFGLNMF